MTKKEFWKKWIIKVYGGHAPHRVLQKKEEFFNDLDLIMLNQVNLSSQSVITWSTTVNSSMLNLGHEWVFPPLETYETAYCICDKCGVTSEEKACEQVCKNSGG